MRIEFDDGELAVAQSVAIMRRLMNQGKSVTDTRRDSRRQPYILDLLGTVSELAWAKLFGVFPDLSIHVRNGGFDSVLNGVTFDVKATDKPEGRLLVTPKKAENPADVYVLAIVSDKVIDFVGCATPAEIFQDSTLIDLGYGPTHALTQQQLHPFTEDDVKKIGVLSGVG